MTHMTQSIFAFLLSGVFVGGALGALSGLLSMPSSGHGLYVLGSLGLHGVAGALIGTVLGLVHPSIPTSLHLTNLVASLKRALLPGEHDALQRRCRVATTIWLTTGIVLLGAAFLADGYHLILSRIQSPEFAAVGVGLFGLFVVAGGLAVTTPAQSALSRAAENLVRRRPNLTFMVHPLINLLLALILATLWIIAGATVPESLILMLPWRALTILGVTVSRGYAKHRKKQRVNAA